MKKQEIIQELTRIKESGDINLADIFYEEPNRKTFADFGVEDNYPESIRGWKFTYVKSHGGYPGAGDDFWLVFLVDVPDSNTVMLKCDGEYIPYDGAELHGPIYEVRPVEYTAIRYDEV